MGDFALNCQNLEIDGLWDAVDSVKVDREKVENFLNHSVSVLREYFFVKDAKHLIIEKRNRSHRTVTHFLFQ